MGSLSIWHWVVVLLVVLLLFGSGKVSNLMGDFAKGIKAFKKNMADDESMEATAERPSTPIAAPSTAAPPVRETVREDDFHLSIFFDPRRPGDEEPEAFAEKFERGVEMAASLARHFVNEGADVELVTPDERVEPVGEAIWKG